MNHTNTSEINIVDMPFDIETASVLDAYVALFIILSLAIFFFIFYTRDIIFNILGFVWFIAWTAIFALNGVHNLFIIVMFVFAGLSLFLGSD